MPAQVFVGCELAFCRPILQQNTLSRAQDVQEHRHWQIINADTGLPQIDRHPFMAALRLGVDAIGISMGRNQQTSLRPSVLQR
jgi:hypothetical protein